tara:strand:- start:3154 stop:3348 length:195 start_codon:yes stop_codon:yes gene_type:complete
MSTIVRERVMIKEIDLEYTANNLVKLAREVWGDNATEYLAGRLESVITYNQMKILIDSLKVERT